LLCTSLSILHGRKASHFVHGRRYGVGLSVEVGLGLLGLYLWWGKPRFVTSRSCLGLVVVPKALAMACLSVVASPFAILPPPPSRFCLLAPYSPLSWHLTASPPLWLAPYCYSPAGTLLLLTGWRPTARWPRSPLYPPRSSQSSSVTPGHGIALPPWLPPTPWSNNVMTGAAVVYSSSVGPLFPWFSKKSAITILSLRPAFLCLSETFFCLGLPAEGFGSLYLYVSMNCFLACLGY